MRATMILDVLLSAIIVVVVVYVCVLWPRSPEEDEDVDR